MDHTRETERSAHVPFFGKEGYGEALSPALLVALLGHGLEADLVEEMHPLLAVLLLLSAHREGHLHAGREHVLARGAARLRGLGRVLHAAGDVALGHPRRAPRAVLPEHEARRLCVWTITMSTSIIGRDTG